jgi:hypothetical protein
LEKYLVIIISSIGILIVFFLMGSHAADGRVIWSEELRDVDFYG